MTLPTIRGWDDVVGMNARNALIARDNPTSSIALVNDKHATKQALAEVGAPFAPTLSLLTSRRELRRFPWADLPDAWAMKPNQSLGGSGIVIASERAGASSWRKPSGGEVTQRELATHAAFVLDGEYSPRASDHVLFEPLLVADPELARMSYQGLPDVRVICTADVPRVAMLRLPTSASGGRANLHQRAVGAAVDLATGRVVAARAGKQSVTHHPDSGEPIVGSTVPHWGAVLDAARRCHSATGLSYVGADIVVDAARGPLILEVNARPGLQIQNVTGHGMAALVDAAVA